jgi:hypothetical protein
VVWESHSQDGSGFGVFGQRYASNGARLGTEFQVNTYTAAYQLGANVAGGSAGNFVVVWSSNTQDGSSFGVFGQRFGSLAESAAAPALSGGGLVVLALGLVALGVSVVVRSRRVP